MTHRTPWTTNRYPVTASASYRFIGVAPGIADVRSSDADHLQELGRRQQVTEIERSEEGVLRRTLVEPHRIDDLFEVRGVPRPERDTPLPVIEAGRGGDDLGDSPSERHATTPVLAHQLGS